MAVESMVKDIATVVGLVVGGCGFLFGLYQYYVGQKWKKSEFAARQLELLESDQRLATVCKLLDWSTRLLPVPEEYQALTAEKVFLHNWVKLMGAMAPEEKKGAFDWQEMLYRDLFDHYFDYLERVNHYISIRLITTHDVANLRYWLEQLAAPRFVTEPVFEEFIQAYGYPGVLELGGRFGIDLHRA